MIVISQSNQYVIVVVGVYNTATYVNIVLDNHATSWNEAGICTMWQLYCNIFEYNFYASISYYDDGVVTFTVNDYL